MAGPLLHIRYEGRSHDLEQNELDLGDMSTDADVRMAVAVHFDQPLVKLEGFVVDRNLESGDITLRPQAVFG